MHLSSAAQVVLALPCLSSYAESRYTPAHGDCKAYPGTPSWPKSDSWKALNNTVDGRLLAPTPPGAVCHADQPTFNNETCSAVAKAWKTFEFHTNDPVSVMWDNFSNFTCLPDASAPCSAAGYPGFVINATTAQHVQAGVKFARKHNIRLNVKSTGHDYIGRSNAPGALSIWTHHLNDVQFHEGSFTLAGSGKQIEGSAITVGGGSQMYDVYKVSDKHGQTVVGGGGKTVGVGGYATGAGHSLLSSTYGLAADNVLEMELVTPMGDIITVNEDTHGDLFWALRGGGGSTFGVITSMTMRTHKTPKIQAVYWAFATKDPDSPIAYDLMAYVASEIPNLMAAGMSGYNWFMLKQEIPIPFPDGPKVVSGIVSSSVLMSSKEVNTSAADAIFKPLIEHVDARWNGQVQFLKIEQSYDSFLAWYDINYDHGSAGGAQYLVSRLLDKDCLTKDPEALASALETALSVSGSVSAYMVAGKGVHDAQPRGGGNAVNPAWRRAYTHSLSGMGFAPFNKTAANEVIKTLDDAYEPLRKLTPRSGSYMNEGLAFEKDWQHAFWGDHYERLFTIKRRVDPHDVFWCTPCVGNERWQQKDNGQLCKV